MSHIKGISVPHRKNTAESVPVRMPAPKIAYYPMTQHIGAPATPTVKKGDAVCVGTLIGEAAGFVSSPIYSGVSGTVKSVEETLQPSGAAALTGELYFGYPRKRRRRSRRRGLSHIGKARHKGQR